MRWGGQVKSGGAAEGEFLFLSNASRREGEEKCEKATYRSKGYEWRMKLTGSTLQFVRKTLRTAITVIYRCCELYLRKVGGGVALFI